MNKELKVCPCRKDEENELLENLWWDLKVMYKRDAAMADNGIPFRDRIVEFMKAWNTRTADKRIADLKQRNEQLKSELRRLQSAVGEDDFEIIEELLKEENDE